MFFCFRRQLCCLDSDFKFCCIGSNLISYFLSFAELLWSVLACMVQKSVGDVAGDCLRSPSPGSPLVDSPCFLQWPWCRCVHFWVLSETGLSVSFHLYSIPCSLSLSRKPWKWGRQFMQLFSYRLCTYSLYQKNLSVSVSLPGTSVLLCYV